MTSWRMSTSRPSSIAMIMSSASSTIFEYSSFPVGRPLPKSQFQAPFRPPYSFSDAEATLLVVTVRSTRAGWWNARAGLQERRFPRCWSCHQRRWQDRR